MPVTPLDATVDVVTLTEDLCNISSVSGDEGALADAIEQVLRAQSHLEVVRDGDSLVARTNLGRTSRVVIAGHIDVVPVADNLPVRRVDVNGEASLWGRGTVDMKGGVAVALKLACELSSPNVDITWIFYDHEEVDAALNGLGRLSRNHPELIQADFAVLCEPTAAVIEGGCNGTMRVAVTASGVKAHSARPWMGENAIHGLTEVLSRLTSNKPETVSVEGLDYRESLNAVMVSGGIATNVIPDSAMPKRICARSLKVSMLRSPMLRLALVPVWIARRLVLLFRRLALLLVRSMAGPMLLDSAHWGSRQ
jgi:succinyl-diaminopimelate desuccinylase